MAYCGPRGIPLSAFLSWSQDDQEAALGWQAHEARRCGACGTHADDWNEQVGGSREAYHPELYECRGCLKIERAKQAPELASGETPGVHVRLATGTHGGCPRCRPSRSAPAH